MSRKRKARKKDHITRAQRRKIDQAFRQAIDSAGGEKIGRRKYDMTKAVEREGRKNGNSAKE